MPFKILIVDDEPDVEALLSQRFRKRVRAGELELLFACNGQEALERLSPGGFDLVVTDLNMPVMDGLTLLARIGESAAPTMSIIVSAYGDMENIRAAMNLGAFDFLTKPLSFTDLDTTLEKSFRVLERNRLAAREHDTLAALQQELNIAREIQQSMQPQIDHTRAAQYGLAVQGEMVAAQEVGGDFYDFFFLDDDRVGFTMADVSGKGIPAALFMTMSKTLLKAAAFTGLSPAQCLESVNHFLGQDNETCMFVTVFYGVFDRRTRELCYANGGHELPFLLRGEPVEIAPVRGGMVGMHVSSYEEGRVLLEPGDALFLYTDGVTEATNTASLMLGKGRLRELLVGGEPQDLCARVLAAVRAFADGAPQSDDITMLALRLLAP